MIDHFKQSRVFQALDHNTGLHSIPKLACTTVELLDQVLRSGSKHTHSAVFVYHKVATGFHWINLFCFCRVMSCGPPMGPHVALMVRND